MKKRSKSPKNVGFFLFLQNVVAFWNQVRRGIFDISRRKVKGSGEQSKDMKENYLSGSVDVIRIILLTSSQWHMGDVLHWVGQS